MSLHIEITDPRTEILLIATARHLGTDVAAVVELLNEYLPPIKAEVRQAILAEQSRVEQRVDRVQEFSRLAQTWRQETGMLSSLEEKFLHPAYLRIIGMGPDALAHPRGNAEAPRALVLRS